MMAMWKSVRETLDCRLSRAAAQECSRGRQPTEMGSNFSLKSPAGATASVDAWHLHQPPLSHRVQHEEASSADYDRAGKTSIATWAASSAECKANCWKS